jgi:hypothetical protein
MVAPEGDPVLTYQAIIYVFLVSVPLCFGSPPFSKDGLFSYSWPQGTLSLSYVGMGEHERFFLLAAMRRNAIALRRDSVIADPCPSHRVCHRSHDGRERSGPDLQVPFEEERRQRRAGVSARHDSDGHVYHANWPVHLCKCATPRPCIWWCSVLAGFGLQCTTFCAAADRTVGLDSECRGALDRPSDRHVSRRHWSHAGFQFDPELVRIPNPLRHRPSLPHSAVDRELTPVPPQHRRRLLPVFRRRHRISHSPPLRLRVHHPHLRARPLPQPRLGVGRHAPRPRVPRGGPGASGGMSDGFRSDPHTVLARTDVGRCSSMGSVSGRGTSSRTESERSSVTSSCGADVRPFQVSHLVEPTVSSVP